MGRGGKVTPSLESRASYGSKLTCLPSRRLDLRNSNVNQTRRTPLKYVRDNGTRAWGAAVALVAGVAAVVSVLAAFGVFTSETSGDSLKIARAVAVDEGTFRVSISRADSRSSQTHSTGQGTVDASSSRSIIRYTFPSSAQIFEVYAEPAHIYVKADFPSQTPWVGITPRMLSRQSPDDAFLATAFSFQYATGWTSDLSVMLRALKSVRGVGHDTLFGNRVMHYRGAVDILGAAQDANVRRLTPAMMSALALSAMHAIVAHNKMLPVDFWVDGGGHIVRIVYTVREPGKAAETLTYDLSDFGVQFEPPTPDELAR
jgi:hypothetical protein